MQTHWNVQFKEQSGESALYYRVQDLGRGSCSKNESQSPSDSNRISAIPSRATAKPQQEENTSNIPQPTLDASTTQVLCLRPRELNFLGNA